MPPREPPPAVRRKRSIYSAPRWVAEAAPVYPAPAQGLIRKVAPSGGLFTSLTLRVVTSQSVRPPPQHSAEARTHCLRRAHFRAYNVIRLLGTIRDMSGDAYSKATCPESSHGPNALAENLALAAVILCTYRGKRVKCYRTKKYKSSVFVLYTRDNNAFGDFFIPRTNSLGPYINFLGRSGVLTLSGLVFARTITDRCCQWFATGVGLNDTYRLRAFPGSWTVRRRTLSFVAGPTSGQNGMQNYPRNTKK